MKEVCRVCFLIDGDKRKKEGKFCKACDAFICTKCEPDIIRRGVAMLKDKWR